MTIKQLSVFIENNTGALSHITEILAKHNIDIRAMSLAETDNFGVLRLIVDNTVAAGDALEKNKIVFHFTDVVAAAVPDEPGGLHKLLSLLAEKGINITYMYAFITVSGHNAAVVLRISSAVREQAIAIMKDAGIRLLGEEDVSNL